jgi:hypothetical protein
MKPFALFGTIAFLGISAAAGAATPEAQLMAPIRLLNDSFNKGDMKTAPSTLSSSGVTIIDEIPPYVWEGPTAFDSWLKAYGAFEQAEGITDDMYTMGKPTRVVASGDRGYVALPVVYTFSQKGMAMREAAHMVFTLRKETGGWLITGFTWVAATAKPIVGAAK